MIKKHSNKSKFNLNNIGFKLTSIIIILCIVPLYISGFLSYKKSYSVLEDNFKITSQQTLSEVNRGLDNYFDKFETQLNMLSENIDFTSIEENPEYAPFLNYLLENVATANDDIIGVYFGTVSKKFFQYPNDNLSADFDPTSRHWYSDAVKNKGRVTYCEPYNDVITGKIVISISKTVEKDGKLVGVISIDLDAEKISNKLSQTKIGKEGYVFIFNPDGVMLAHPDTEIIGTDEVTKQSFWEDVSYKTDGVVEYEYNNSNKIGIYNTNLKTGWRLMCTLDESEFLSDVNTLKNTTLFLVTLCTLICILVSIFITRGFVKNIVKIKDSMEKASRGDLTANVFISTKDEFSMLAASFNEMIASISNLIRNAEKSSIAVLETSDSFVKIADETSEAINGMASTMQEISTGTSEQAKSTEEGSLAINDLSDKISNINHYTIEVDSIVGKTNDITNTGLVIVEDLTEKSKETLNSSLEVSKIVGEVNNSAEHINAITETITNITEQTNLLALNAAIEAARAGESGKGFSVVAEEIRKLAEQSRDSAKEIKEIINEMQQKSKEAVMAMNKSEKSVQAQESSVKETEEIFNDILKSMRVITEKVSGIKNLTLNLEENKVNIISQMENISAISEENAAGTEEVTASTEEVAATMEQFVSQADNLKEVVKELESELNKFKI
ncbi:methyl-accepting chemotaxis protein [uncultured Clostridium sp.]|uniref:methyl-accepting chemotaxis protein n=1 Tax=uncultured Clostridium sp. TaxID=59620 RepID=UPI0028F0362E|nr:methyl-accepting chemotaxis protein [uncultured Clostridium sp.]